jgi:hypothetical protein
LKKGNGKHENGITTVFKVPRPVNY